MKILQQGRPSTQRLLLSAGILASCLVSAIPAVAAGPSSEGPMATLVVTAAAAREAAILNPDANGGPGSPGSPGAPGNNLDQASPMTSAPSHVREDLTAENQRCAGVLSHPSSFEKGAVEFCRDEIVR